MIGAAVAAAAAIILVGGRAILNRERAAVPLAASIPIATPASTPAGTSRNRVVLTWFVNQSGNPDDDWLSHSLPEMLTTDLVRSEGLEVISTQRLYDLLAMSGRNEVSTLDRSTATELARWAGAGEVIGGSIFRSGATYRIDVQAHDTTSGQVVAASRVEGDDVFRMADQLAADPALAEQKLRDLVRLRPREVEPLVWLAQSLSVTPMKAMKSLRHALDLDPNDPLAVAALVGQMRALGLSDDAGAILNDFLQRHPAAGAGPIQEFRIDNLRTQ